MTPGAADTPQMTVEQRRLARQALGLPNINRESYRNRFVCGPGHSDRPHWVRLHVAGLARYRIYPDDAPFVSEWFHLTRRGAKMALDPGERLDGEDFAEGEG